MPAKLGRMINAGFFNVAVQISCVADYYMSFAALARGVTVLVRFRFACDVAKAGLNIAV